jgi:hypothetical protein
MAVKNRRDGVLTVIDGTPVTPVEVEVEFLESDFTYNEPVANDPIPIKTRKGALSHVKRNDMHAGFGEVSFSLKYVNNDIKEALCNPANTTAVEADKIPAKCKCVNLQFELYNEAGAVEETHVLHNCYFKRGQVVYQDGDEYSTQKATGIIFGKYDAAADSKRTFVTVT